MENIESNTDIQPGKFVCPKNFEETVGIGGLCIEDLEDDDNELWIIQAPSDADFLQFHGQEVKLNGTSEIKLGNQNYKCNATEGISTELTEFSLILPSRTEGKLRAVSKPFQGHISFIGGINVPLQDSPLTFPEVPAEEPSNLIPRYKPFGLGEPLIAHESKKKKSNREEKKKKNVSRSEDYSTPTCIESECQSGFDNVLPVSHKKKKKRHTHERSVDHSTSAAFSSTYVLSQELNIKEEQGEDLIGISPESLEDGTSSFDVLNERKYKKKKRKGNKTGEMSE